MVERQTGDLALCLSHFSAEQTSALLKLIVMFYLVPNRNYFL